MNFREAVQPYTEQQLTKQILMNLLKEYKRPFDKINELVKQDLLIQVKRGIYIPGKKINIAPPELFLLRGIEAEFKALGVTVSVEEKDKTATTNVDSAFLKSDTTWKELIIKKILPQEAVKMRPTIKIKIEVDTKPPLGFETEEKLLLKPFSFYTKCFTLPDLFAGKMHALLFRKWKGRVKGRDWFDMEWYIKKGIPLNLDHFVKRAMDSGDWIDPAITIEQFMSLLTEKINAVSFSSIRNDVVRFIPDDRVLEIWSPAYFNDLIQKITFKNRLHDDK